MGLNAAEENWVENICTNAANEFNLCPEEFIRQATGNPALFFMKHDAVVRFLTRDKK